VTVPQVTVIVPFIALPDTLPVNVAEAPLASTAKSTDPLSIFPLIGVSGCRHALPFKVTVPDTLPPCPENSTLKSPPPGTGLVLVHVPAHDPSTVPLLACSPALVLVFEPDDAELLPPQPTAARRRTATTTVPIRLMP
jgi:hypothetical protein